MGFSGKLRLFVLHISKDLIEIARMQCMNIKSCIGKVKDAVSNVAETIKSFLHFSVPDVGPLADYESWMPDFMSGLASGIEKSKSLVSDAMSSVAGDMVLRPQADLSGITQSSSSSGAVTDILSGIQSALADLKSSNTGDISIPVYLGGTLLDEVVVNAQTRQNLRSGGR